VLECGSSPGLARSGEGVELLAPKTLQRGDQIRRDALRHDRMQLTQVGIVAVQPGTV
jgi:hypothetical protein